MYKKKSTFGFIIAVVMLFSIQTVHFNTEVQVGSWLGSQVTDNIHGQRAIAGMTGVAGGIGGTWAAGKIGAAIGTTIAPGVGTVIGAGIGIL